MSRIIGFFDHNKRTIRAARLEGLLVKNKKTKYWQMKHGNNVMPFPHTLFMFSRNYVEATIHCVASTHIPIGMTTEMILYDEGYSHTLGREGGRIVVRTYGSNIHTIEFDGYLSQTKKGNWSLTDTNSQHMPLGRALNNIECRLVEIDVESIYSYMPSILNCQKQNIYP